MQTQTCIPGKDAPLENTIAKVKGFLTQLGIELEEASHLNPVPHCWSVHIRDAKCPALYTNGKGTSPLSSLASGIGEFVERLATDFFFSGYFLGDVHQCNKADSFCFFPDEIWFSTHDSSENIEQFSHAKSSVTLLNSELLGLYNPEGELKPAHLIDNNFDNNNREICALPFINISDSSTCYFPVNILNNLYVSNGMAAGNTPAECRSQALSEIIERYVKNRVIANGVSLPIISDADLSEFPHLLTIKKTLMDNNFSITIHDCSLGGQYPVICVLLVDTVSGGAYAAFGANCRFEVAIERTLTELLQGRDLDQLHNFSFPVHSLELVADHYNLESHFIDSDGLLSWTMFKDSPDYPYSPWSFNGDTEEEEAELLQRITSSGFSVYRRDYLHCGLYSCRFVVPGMSEIYPVDDLVWNNRNIGARLRPLLLQLPYMENSQLETTLELIEELELDDHLPISHVIGVIFEKDSNWDSLRIGELKAHIYLALGDHHNALILCSRIVELAQLRRERLALFTAILTLLQFQEASESPEHYSTSLERFFKESDLATAHDVIRRKRRFFGLVFKPSWQEVSPEHAKIITLYEDMKKMKAGRRVLKG